MGRQFYVYILASRKHGTRPTIAGDAAGDRCRNRYLHRQLAMTKLLHILLPILLIVSPFEIACAQTAQSSTSSTQPGFRAAGGGAVDRTGQSKLQDFVNAADYGLLPSNSASANNTALNNIAALTTNPTVFINPGNYQLPCNTQHDMKSAISLIGMVQYTVKFQLPAGCALSQPYLFQWFSRSGVVSDITIDLNTPRKPRGDVHIVQFLAYAGDINGARVNHVSIINGGPNNYLITYAATGGHKFYNLQITNNYLTLAAPNTTGDSCVTGVGDLKTGTIVSPVITGNTCKNTAMGLAGLNPIIAGNDISGFNSGTGVSFNGLSAHCYGATITDNKFHDTSSTLDSGGTSPGGLEMSCPGSVISNNRAYNLGGAGFVNFADDAIYKGNFAYNNGKSGNTGVGAYSNQCGIAALTSSSALPLLKSARLSVIGNTAYDDGTGTQHWGYCELAAGGAFTDSPNILNNNFSGPSGPMKLVAGVAGVGYASGVFTTGRVGNAATTQTGRLSANMLYATPLILDAAYTWTGLSINVTATGTAANCRLGIFNSVDGYPNTLLLDAGALHVGKVGTKTATIHQLLRQGVYYGVVVCDGSLTVSVLTPTPSNSADQTYFSMVGQTLIGINDGSLTKSFVYGALGTASPFGTVTRGSGNLPLVALSK